MYLFFVKIIRLKFVIFLVKVKLIGIYYFDQYDMLFIKEYKGKICKKCMVQYNILFVDFLIIKKNCESFNLLQKWFFYFYSNFMKLLINIVFVFREYSEKDFDNNVGLYFIQIIIILVLFEVLESCLGEIFILFGCLFDFFNMIIEKMCRILFLFI